MTIAGNYNVNPCFYGGAEDWAVFCVSLLKLRSGFTAKSNNILFAVNTRLFPFTCQRLLHSSHGVYIRVHYDSAVTFTNKGNPITLGNP